MTILIAYATTEGQTRKIARFCADYLVENDHSVEMLNVKDVDAIALAGFEQVILAGSVHVGKFQKELVSFVTLHVSELNLMPNLFLAVSLAAAGDEPDDIAGLKTVMSDFSAQTDWTPARFEHVAGAFRFSEYDFLKSWAMRWIAMKKGQVVSADEDTEYTDWDVLKGVLAEWITKT